MPRGANPKREREYEEIVSKSKAQGRYKGREEEVAARIVNKQRHEAGETRGARSGTKAASKRSPARRRRTGEGTRRVKPSASARTARKQEGGRKPTGRSRRTGRKVSSSPNTHYTIDHDEIRHWAEERGGTPSRILRTSRGKGDPGMIRLDFPGYSGAGSLAAISWDEWFEKFDESKLALAYQDRTARGQKSNFNKLVGRETVPLQ